MRKFSIAQSLALVAVLLLPVGVAAVTEVSCCRDQLCGYSVNNIPYKQVKVSPGQCIWIVDEEAVKARQSGTCEAKMQGAMRAMNLKIGNYVGPKPLDDRSIYKLWDQTYRECVEGKP